MAFLADSQGQLVIRYDNAADFVCFVNGCLDNLCRAQSIGNILCRIFTVFYNINLFTAQLVNDSLHTHALMAYAGTYRINIAVSGIYGNFGAHTGLAGNGFDFNNAVMDFRNLQLKQALQQAGYDGVVTVKPSDTDRSYVSEDIAYSIPAGYQSKYMADSETSGEAVLENAAVFVCASPIMSIHDILPLLNEASIQKQPLLLLSESIAPEVGLSEATMWCHGPSL